MSVVPKFSNGLPCLTMDIFFPTNGNQGRLGTRFMWGEKKVFMLPPPMLNVGGFIWPWFWLELGGMCGKLGNCIKDSTEGDDNGVVEEKLSNPGVPIYFFLLFFLYIMLTRHINDQGCLVFDIFVNVFAETYIMAG